MSEREVNEAWFDLIFLVFTITLDQSSAMQLEAFTTVHLTFATASQSQSASQLLETLQGSRLLFHNDIQVIYFLLAVTAFVTGASP